jgi:hypothetical protein
MQPWNVKVNKSHKYILLVFIYEQPVQYNYFDREVKY